MLCIQVKTNVDSKIIYGAASESAATQSICHIQKQQVKCLHFPQFGESTSQASIIKKPRPQALDNNDILSINVNFVMNLF